MLKHYNGKIQVGDMLLDAEIDVEEKVEISPEAKAYIERIHQRLQGLHGPRETFTDLRKRRSVDSTLVEPIVDPARLLEEAE